MPPDITIRPANAGDIPAISALYGPYVENTAVSFEFDAPSAEEMARRWHDLKTSGFPYLVAESGGKLAGFAYAGPFRARPAYERTVENSIYLAPGCQGQGIGIALMGALIAACRDKGYRYMIAGISDDGAKQSVPFHEKLGFILIGRFDGIGLKKGRAVGISFMQLALSPEAP